MRAKHKLRALAPRALRLHRPRSGLVLVTAALALVALMTLAALSVDLGRLGVATQQAQAVADAAAIAAASQLPDQNTASLRLADVVAANNAAVGWPTVVVSSNDVTYYYPGDTVPGFRQLASDEYAVGVTAHVNDQYTFGRVAGLEEMHTTRSATALVNITNRRWPAIFALQDTMTEDGFVSSGGGVFIDGDVHSNSNVDLRGSDYTITGQIRYRWNLWAHKDVTIMGGAHQISASEPYPIGHPWNQNFSEVETYFGQASSSGSVTFGPNTVLEPGLYLINGDVTFNSSGHVLDGVTLVATGKIRFNGAASLVTPAVHGVSLVSYSYDDRAIVFNGANQESSGTVFAPNGGITYHGSNSYNSSLMGYQVTMRGGDYAVKGSEDPDGEPIREARLVR